LEANYVDEEGRPDRLCAKHAVAAGTLASFYPGASKAACQFFDAVELRLGRRLPHVHLVPGQSPEGTEARDLVPGRRFRPDAYVAELKEVWFYHGDWFHGFPPGHAKHLSFVHRDQWGPDLVEATMDSMRLFLDAGYSVKYAWESKWQSDGLDAIETLRSSS
jgi:hypothetical protein